MRKILILLSIFFMATSNQMSAQCGDNCGCDSAACCCCCKCLDKPSKCLDKQSKRFDKPTGSNKHRGHNRNKKKGAYFKDTFNVYYNGVKMTDASASSFVDLGHGYAKDDFCVYFHGQKLEDAMPSSFKVMNDGYACDAFNTYYHGKKIN